MEVMTINDPFSRLNLGFGWELKKKKKLWNNWSLKSSACCTSTGEKNCIFHMVKIRKEQVTGIYQSHTANK